MKQSLQKLIRAVLLSVALLVCVGAGLFGYFLYTPDAVEPKLSGTLRTATIKVSGVSYTYRLYQPKDLTAGSPLVVVLHGSGQNGAQIRMETGFGFDRLADQQQFAVLYPSSKSFDWNDCSKTGDFNAEGHQLDHVAYLNELVDTLVASHQFDQQRIFAAGVSSGGFMSLRLALESASRFRAVAAVSANVPAPANFKCQLQAASSSVLLLNGTADPLVPYQGGRAALWGMFFDSGDVLSAQASAEFFAGHNQLPPAKVADSSIGRNAATEHATSSNMQRRQWHNNTRVQVELLSIQGGGHGMPQPYWQRPRLLGPSPMQPDGPVLIWQFFARQQP